MGDKGNADERLFSVVIDAARQIRTPLGTMVFVSALLIHNHWRTENEN
jgi:hypothetical protein